MIHFITAEVPPASTTIDAAATPPPTAAAPRVPLPAATGNAEVLPPEHTQSVQDHGTEQQRFRQQQWHHLQKQHRDHHQQQKHQDRRSLQQTGQVRISTVEGNDPIYRVTQHVGSNLPLTSKHKFRFGLACRGWGISSRTLVGLT